MKTFEINYDSQSDVLNLIKKQNHLISIFINNAWFQDAPDLKPEIICHFELSQNSFLIQFAMHNTQSADEIVPASVVAIVNHIRGSGTFYFMPISILSFIESGVFEIKIREYESSVDHIVEKVLPGIDCYKNPAARNRVATVVPKLCVISKNHRGKMISDIDFALEPKIIVESDRDQAWYPINHKSLNYT